MNCFGKKMYQLLSACLFVHYILCATVQRPSQREDVMGTYFLMNRYQCERLCWYRKLCKTYSYIYNRTLATDGNCVLHAGNIFTDTTSGVSTAWTEREAFWDKILQDNGCRSRPCNDIHVCVPTFASPFYTCVPFAAECKSPSRDDGVYSDVTLVQGQRTNFTCSSSLVWAPRHADKTVTCQVTGKYSELQGTCKNTIYYSPTVPFNQPLPDVASEGWEACIKGNFTGPARMTFTLHDAQAGSCDYTGSNDGSIYLTLDFRYNYGAIKDKISWFTAHQNCTWSGRHEVGALPLDPNVYFEITLRILVSNKLEIIYKNITTQQVDLAANKLNLTGATYLEIIRDIKLFYVDLGRGCD